MADPYLEHETTVEDLAAQLPSFMPKDPSSGNYKLLKTVADRLDALQADIVRIGQAKSVQQAQTIEELERLAVAVDLKRKTGESLEKFRARVLAEYALLTSEATVKDLLNGGALILGVSPSNLGYTETHVTEPGRAALKVTHGMVDSVSLTEQELAEALERIIAASYALDVLVEGTFTYLAETAYTGPYDSANGGYDPAKLNSDPDLGHDGLDSNGDPKDTGGTYSGLLN